MRSCYGIRARITSTRFELIGTVASGRALQVQDDGDVGDIETEQHEGEVREGLARSVDRARLVLQKLAEYNNM